MGTSTTNLASRIQERLPPELSPFLRTAGDAAQQRGQRLYLVGGVVRDLLLGLTNLDLDLVVEGDAVALAQAVAARYQAKLTVHKAFATAKVKWDHWAVDFATARAETYPRPGALPVVRPSTLQDDLIRRDFTVNAMAVDLTPARYGELVDLYGGQGDLEQKLIRVLHDRSFIDDATRILRGVRYEQRLGFQFEEKTLALLRRDTPMLDTISADRLRHEIELFLKEPAPEKVLLRAHELGVLSRIHPALPGDEWLTKKFEEGRKASAAEPPSPNLYLALLACRMKPAQVEGLIGRLNFPKTAAQLLRDTVSIKSREALLDDYRVSRSAIYRQLEGLSPLAIQANAIAASHLIARRHFHLYLSELRQVRTALNGADLLALGVPQGPQVKEALARLLDARLDGRVKSKEDELSLAREWLGGT